MAHYVLSDSLFTEGYTSISVREPLSNIRAQSGKPPSQPHYATVSDDSGKFTTNLYSINVSSLSKGSWDLTRWR